MPISNNEDPKPPPLPLKSTLNTAKNILPSSIKGNTPPPLPTKLPTIFIDSSQSSTPESSPSESRKKSLSSNSSLYPSNSLSSSTEDLFDSNFICKKIIETLDNNPDRAIAAIEYLCGSNDARFAPHCSAIRDNNVQGRFSFDKEAILTIINNIKDKIQKDGSFQTKKEDYSQIEKSTKKDAKEIAPELVGLVKREDVTKKIGSEIYIQNACHATIDNNYISLSENSVSSSAELSKNQRNVITLANTASITIESKEGQKVICFRSAKSHKKHLQEQRSLTDIASRIKATPNLTLMNKDESLNGFTCRLEKSTGKKFYEYQPMIASMMDQSSLKAAGTSAVGVFKRLIKRSTNTPIENEKKFFYKIALTNNERFSKENAPKGYIKHTIVNPHYQPNAPKSTKFITVREYPAIIQNQVFSSQSKGKGNRSKARASNLPGQILMLKKFKEKHLESNLFTEDESTFLLKLTTKTFDTNKINKIKNIIKNLYEKVQKDNTLQNKDEIIMVLKAFQANIIGISFDGLFSYDKANSGADLSILSGIQADYFNLSYSPQCKSGNDRTIVATALKIASKQFHKEHGIFFNPEAMTPDNINSKNDIQEFKKFYTEALITFGFANVEASRGPENEKGQSALKIASSPSACKYISDNDQVLQYGELQ